MGLLLTDSNFAMSVLQAGPLQMRLENGALRSVKWGEIEVVRMIYGATRDPNWLSLPPRIENQRSAVAPGHFHIEFDTRFCDGEIDFLVHIRIDGAADGRLDFEFSGVAQRDFSTNRIGLCVHLPLRECASKPVTLASGGATRNTHFPREISPHQPFFAVESLDWQPSPQCRARLELSGEVFESEDQRNWTDASFKIYSRPLAWPFPFEIKAGGRIEQRVSLIFEAFSAAVRAPETAPISLSLSGETRALPQLGFGASTDWTPDFLSAAQVAALRELPFAFLRAEVRLFEANWHQQWQRAWAEAAQLERPLELALWFGKEAQNELAALSSWLQSAGVRRQEPPIAAILILQSGAKVTPDSLFETLAPQLREIWPTTPIGGGTDAFFAELNRNRPSAGFDFSAYSINPQVHAEDDFSLVENMAAQAETVRSARTFWHGALHVGPVTLRRRNNPDATAPMPAPRRGETPWNVDARQITIFGALWTLGSLKYLSESGAERVTFYEVAGMCGLCGGGEMVPPFSAWKDQFFPLYAVFRELIGFESVEISHSSAPLEVEVLALCNSQNRRKILLANFALEAKTVALPWAATRVRVMRADARDFEAEAASGAAQLTLVPLSLTVIE